MTDNRGKFWIAGGLVLMVLAGVILFLFVMPAITGSSDGAAQAQPSGGGMPGGGMGGPPGGGMGGGMPGGGMAGGGMGGGMPGGGMAGGGMGGGMTGGAAGGMEGGGAGGTGAAAAPIGPDSRKLEGSRPNPFLPRGTVADGGGAAGPPLRTRYGANWSQLPITYRLGFVRPRVPAPREVAPPQIELPAADMIVTSILWTQDGQAIAGYEAGGKQGVVKPGDIVDTWQVVEIGRNYVVVADRESGRQRTVYMSAKPAAPAPTAAPSGTPQTPTGGRRRPTAPPVRR